MSAFNAGYKDYPEDKSYKWPNNKAYQKGFDFHAKHEKTKKGFSFDKLRNFCVLDLSKISTQTLMEIADLLERNDQYDLVNQVNSYIFEAPFKS